MLVTKTVLYGNIMSLETGNVFQTCGNVEFVGFFFLQEEELI